MVVEAAVLGRRDRLDEVFRQRLDPHMAAPQAPLGEHGAVRGEDGDVGRPVVEGGEHGVRDPRDEVDHGAAEHDGAPDAGEKPEAQRLEQVWMLLCGALQPPQPPLAVLRASPRRGPAPRAELGRRAPGGLYLEVSGLRRAPLIKTCPD